MGACINDLLAACGDFDVDVVVPVFNGGRYVRQCLESILAQTYAASRIIVVDDGSTDSTPDIVLELRASDSRIELVRQPHRGVSAARNRGIEMSTAPFIAFVDSDDIWLPEKLREQVNVFRQATPDVGFVHSSYILIDENGDGAPGVVHPPRLRGDIFEPLLHDSYPMSGSASSVMVRRRVLDRAGPWDENLYFAEDFDLWLRLAAISKVDFTPSALVGIRVHAESSQRRYRPRRELDFLIQRLCVYNKWVGACQNRKGLIQRIRKECLAVAARQVRHNDELFCVRKSVINDGRCGNIYKSAFPNDFLFLVHFAHFHVDFILRKLWREVLSRKV